MNSIIKADLYSNPEAISVTPYSGITIVANGSVRIGKIFIINILVTVPENPSNIISIPLTSASQSTNTVGILTTSRGVIKTARLFSNTFIANDAIPAGTYNFFSVVNQT